MIAVQALAGLAILHQVLAMPSFYNGLGICTIPDQAYGKHGIPTEDSSITFMLAEEAGAPVETWEAGGIYTLTVGSYVPAANAWIHATAGTLAPSDDSHTQATACDLAVFSKAPLPDHVLTWTAPADDTICVTVSTAQASGPTAGYNTNMITLPGAGASGCVDGPMAATPMAVEAPMSEVEDVEAPEEATTDETTTPPAAGTPAEPSAAIGAAGVFATLATLWASAAVLIAAF